jgi:hypothetical protein
MASWPAKDPDEVLDYEIDWTKRLDGDTIATSVFEVAVGDAVVDSDSNTTTATTVWLSGGTLDETCEVLNRITTAGGRTMDQTVKLKIKAK